MWEHSLHCCGNNVHGNKFQGIEKLYQTNLGNESKVRRMHLDVGGIPHLYDGGNSLLIQQLNTTKFLTLVLF